ncbi:uncharacterized protein MONOS_8328 [Monocercomonoides exilis]|uniref:uncharacterized protein n=1 Tax=Monocercomonoides exilis TaxID=2049356 RepID=UPI003559CEAD|nr:hypothetical protein MONOS_8328 [Monocercomonoides exilis]|eukprot:MONOS_8328.1-p1 / transcript=MONOS_8328.1 / gene=MONOS_8328 / organism=Monocercomonoides_exilis_PA203 / gene_product=unspecified product / transcript_product=unspecified product / location=Mono_scaffold00312:22652-35496(-) / protein_length=4193 / sequence_SO=supercontig / SO=protein_coding / is_pseudo=false
MLIPCYLARWLAKCDVPLEIDETIEPFALFPVGQNLESILVNGTMFQLLLVKIFTKAHQDQTSNELSGIQFVQSSEPSDIALNFGYLYIYLEKLGIILPDAMKADIYLKNKNAILYLLSCVHTKSEALDGLQGQHVDSTNEPVPFEFFQTIPPPPFVEYPEELPLQNEQPASTEENSENQGQTDNAQVEAPVIPVENESNNEQLPKSEQTEAKTEEKIKETTEDGNRANEENAEKEKLPSEPKIESESSEPTKQLQSEEDALAAALSRIEKAKKRKPLIPTVLPLRVQKERELAEELDKIKNEEKRLKKQLEEEAKKLVEMEDNQKDDEKGDIAQPKNTSEAKTVKGRFPKRKPFARKGISLSEAWKQRDVRKERLREEEEKEKEDAAKRGEKALSKKEQIEQKMKELAEEQQKMKEEQMKRKEEEEAETERIRREEEEAEMQRRRIEEEKALKEKQIQEEEEERKKTIAKEEREEREKEAVITHLAKKMLNAEGFDEKKAVLKKAEEEWTKKEEEKRRAAAKELKEKLKEKEAESNKTPDGQVVDPSQIKKDSENEQGQPSQQQFPDKPETSPFLSSSQRELQILQREAQGQAMQLMPLSRASLRFLRMSTLQYSFTLAQERALLNERNECYLSERGDKERGSVCIGGADGKRILDLPRSTVEVKSTKMDRGRVEDEKKWRRMLRTWEREERKIVRMNQKIDMFKAKQAKIQPNEAVCEKKDEYVVSDEDPAKSNEVKNEDATSSTKSEEENDAKAPKRLNSGAENPSEQETTSEFDSSDSSDLSESSSCISSASLLSSSDCSSSDDCAIPTPSNPPSLSQLLHTTPSTFFSSLSLSATLISPLRQPHTCLDLLAWLLEASFGFSTQMAVELATKRPGDLQRLLCGKGMLCFPALDAAERQFEWEMRMREWMMMERKRREEEEELERIRELEAQKEEAIERERAKALLLRKLKMKQDEMLYDEEINFDGVILPEDPAKLLEELQNPTSKSSKQNLLSAKDSKRKKKRRLLAPFPVYPPSPPVFSEQPRYSFCPSLPPTHPLYLHPSLVFFLLAESHAMQMVSLAVAEPGSIGFVLETLAFGMTSEDFLVARSSCSCLATVLRCINSELERSILREEQRIQQQLVKLTGSDAFNFNQRMTENDEMLLNPDQNQSSISSPMVSANNDAMNNNNNAVISNALFPLQASFTAQPVLTLADVESLQLHLTELQKNAWRWFISPRGGLVVSTFMLLRSDSCYSYSSDAEWGKWKEIVGERAERMEVWLKMKETIWKRKERKRKRMFSIENISSPTKEKERKQRKRKDKKKREKMNETGKQNVNQSEERAREKIEGQIGDEEETKEKDKEKKKKKSKDKKKKGEKENKEDKKNEKDKLQETASYKERDKKQDKPNELFEMTIPELPKESVKKDRPEDKRMTQLREILQNKQEHLPEDQLEIEGNAITSSPMASLNASLSTSNVKGNEPNGIKIEKSDNEQTAKVANIQSFGNKNQILQNKAFDVSIKENLDLNKQKMKTFSFSDENEESYFPPLPSPLPRDSPTLSALITQYLSVDTSLIPSAYASLLLSFPRQSSFDALFVEVLPPLFLGNVARYLSIVERLAMEFASLTNTTLIEKHSQELEAALIAGIGITGAKPRFNGVGSELNKGEGYNDKNAFQMNGIANNFDGSIQKAKDQQNSRDEGKSKDFEGINISNYDDEFDEDEDIEAVLTDAERALLRAQLEKKKAQLNRERERLQRERESLLTGNAGMQPDSEQNGLVSTEEERERGEMKNVARAGISSGGINANSNTSTSLALSQRQINTVNKQQQPLPPLRDPIVRSNGILASSTNKTGIVKRGSFSIPKQMEGMSLIERARMAQMMKQKAMEGKGMPGEDGALGRRSNLGYDPQTGRAMGANVKVIVHDHTKDSFNKFDQMKRERELRKKAFPATKNTSNALQLRGLRGAAHPQPQMPRAHSGVRLPPLHSSSSSPTLVRSNASSPMHQASVPPTASTNEPSLPAPLASSLSASDNPPDLPTFFGIDGVPAEVVENRLAPLRRIVEEEEQRKEAELKEQQKREEWERLPAEVKEEIRLKEEEERIKKEEEEMKELMNRETTMQKRNRMAREERNAIALQFQTERRAFIGLRLKETKRARLVVMRTLAQVVDAAFHLCNYILSMTTVKKVRNNRTMENKQSGLSIAEGKDVENQKLSIKKSSNTSEELQSSNGEFSNLSSKMDDGLAEKIQPELKGEENNLINERKDGSVDEVMHEDEQIVPTALFTLSAPLETLTFLSAISFIIRIFQFFPPIFEYIPREMRKRTKTEIKKNVKSPAKNKKSGKQVKLNNNMKEKEGKKKELKTDQNDFIEIKNDIKKDDNDKSGENDGNVKENKSEDGERKSLVEVGLDEQKNEEENIEEIDEDEDEVYEEDDEDDEHLIISPRIAQLQTLLSAVSASPFVEIWGFSLIRVASLLCSLVVIGGDTEGEEYDEEEFGSEDNRTNLNRKILDKNITQRMVFNDEMKDGYSDNWINSSDEGVDSAKKRSVSSLSMVVAKLSRPQIQQSLPLLFNSSLVYAMLVSFFRNVPSMRTPSFFADSLPLMTLDFPPSPLYPPFSQAQGAVQLTSLLRLFPTSLVLPLLPMLNRIRSRFLRHCCTEADVEMVLAVLHHPLTTSGEGIGIARCAASIVLAGRRVVEGWDESLLEDDQNLQENMNEANRDPDGNSDGRIVNQLDANINKENENNQINPNHLAATPGFSSSTTTKTNIPSFGKNSKISQTQKEDTILLEEKHRQKAKQAIVAEKMQQMQLQAEQQSAAEQLRLALVQATYPHLPQLYWSSDAFSFIQPRLTGARPLPLYPAMPFVLLLRKLAECIRKLAERFEERAGAVRVFIASLVRHAFMELATNQKFMHAIIKHNRKTKMSSAMMREMKAVSRRPVKADSDNDEYEEDDEELDGENEDITELQWNGEENALGEGDVNDDVNEEDGLEGLASERAEADFPDDKDFINKLVKKVKREKRKKESRRGKEVDENEDKDYISEYSNLSDVSEDGMSSIMSQKSDVSSNEDDDDEENELSFALLRKKEEEWRAKKDQNKLLEEQKLELLRLLKEEEEEKSSNKSERDEVGDDNSIKIEVKHKRIKRSSSRFLKEYENAHKASSRELKRPLPPLPPHLPATPDPAAPQNDHWIPTPSQKILVDLLLSLACSRKKAKPADENEESNSISPSSFSDTPPPTPLSSTHVLKQHEKSAPIQSIPAPPSLLGEPSIVSLQTTGTLLSLVAEIERKKMRKKRREMADAGIPYYPPEPKKKMKKRSKAKEIEEGDEGKNEMPDTSEQSEDKKNASEAPELLQEGLTSEQQQTETTEENKDDKEHSQPLPEAIDQVDPSEPQNISSSPSPAPSPSPSPSFSPFMNMSDNVNSASEVLEPPLPPLIPPGAEFAFATDLKNPFFGAFAYNAPLPICMQNLSFTDESYIEPEQPITTPPPQNIPTSSTEEQSFIPESVENSSDNQSAVLSSVMMPPVTLDGLPPPPPSPPYPPYIPFRNRDPLPLMPLQPPPINPDNLEGASLLLMYLLGRVSHFFRFCDVETGAISNIESNEKSFENNNKASAKKKASCEALSLPVPHPSLSKKPLPMSSLFNEELLIFHNDVEISREDIFWRTFDGMFLKKLSSPTTLFFYSPARRQKVWERLHKKKVSRKVFLKVQRENEREQERKRERIAMQAAAEQEQLLRPITVAVQNQQPQPRPENVLSSYSLLQHNQPIEQMGQRKAIDLARRTAPIQISEGVSLRGMKAENAHKQQLELAEARREERLRKQQMRLREEEEKQRRKERETAMLMLVKDATMIQRDAIKKEEDIKKVAKLMASNQNIGAMQQKKAYEEQHLIQRQQALLAQKRMSELEESKIEAFDILVGGGKAFHTKGIPKMKKTPEEIEREKRIARMKAARELGKLYGHGFIPEEGIPLSELIENGPKGDRHIDVQKHLGLKLLNEAKFQPQHFEQKKMQHQTSSFLSQNSHQLAEGNHLPGTDQLFSQNHSHLTSLPISQTSHFVPTLLEQQHPHPLRQSFTLESSSSITSPSMQIQQNPLSLSSSSSSLNIQSEIAPTSISPMIQSVYFQAPAEMKQNLELAESKKNGPVLEFSSDSNGIPSVMSDIVSPTRNQFASLPEDDNKASAHFAPSFLSVQAGLKKDPSKVSIIPDLLLKSRIEEEISQFSWEEEANLSK